MEAGCHVRSHLPTASGDGKSHRNGDSTGARDDAWAWLWLEAHRAERNRYSNPERSM